MHESFDHIMIQPGALQVPPAWCIGCVADLGILYWSLCDVAKCLLTLYLSHGERTRTPTGRIKAQAPLRLNLEPGLLVDSGHAALHCNRRGPFDAHAGVEISAGMAC